MARKEKNIHYIYKTTCNITGKWYIGMHSTLNENDGYLGSGKILRYSIRKYGKENHTKEILEYCETRELLVLRETEIITTELISDGLCMNLKEGGSGGFSSEEHMIKCVKAGREKTNEILKNKFGGNENWLSDFNSYVNKKAWENKDYRNEKIKNLDWNGKNHSEETKQKMSEERKGTGVGESNSQYGTCWMIKDSIVKKVKKDELETHLRDGWKTGRR